MFKFFLLLVVGLQCLFINKLGLFSILWLSNSIISCSPNIWVLAAKRLCWLHKVGRSVQLKSLKVRHVGMGLLSHFFPPSSKAHHPTPVVCNQLKHLVVKISLQWKFLPYKEWVDEIWYFLTSRGTWSFLLVEWNFLISRKIQKSAPWR